MKRGAIFDMDGLMFDTESIWQDGWKKFAAENGYEPSPDFGREISGTSGEVMEGVVHKYYPDVDPKEFIKTERSYVEARLEEDVPIKPGLFEILDMFREHGVPMAVASSSRIEMIRGNLKKAGVEEYFDVVVSSTEVEHAKPEPDVFLYAAEKLGIDAKDCYVFEDSFGGVRAGHAAGSCTVMIPDQQQPTDELRALCDGIFDDLAQTADAIASGKL